MTIFQGQILFCIHKIKNFQNYTRPLSFYQLLKTVYRRFIRELYDSTVFGCYSGKACNSF